MFNTNIQVPNTVRYLSSLQTANAKHIKSFPDLIPIENRGYAAITSRNMGDRRESEGIPEGYSLMGYLPPYIPTLRTLPYEYGTFVLSRLRANASLEVLSSPEMSWWYCICFRSQPLATSVLRVFRK